MGSYELVHLYVLVGSAAVEDYRDFPYVFCVQENMVISPLSVVEA
jgi:hypothetical protein